MTKNTKIIIGVGAVAVVGYLIYKQMSKSKGFASMPPQKVFSAVGSKIPPRYNCNLDSCVKGFCPDGNPCVERYPKDTSAIKNFCSCGKPKCSCSK